MVLMSSARSALVRAAGAIGHGSRMIMMSAGFNIEWATFLAALLVGSIGIQWSRWYLAHPKILPSPP